MIYFPIFVVVQSDCGRIYMNIVLFYFHAHLITRSFGKAYMIRVEFVCINVSVCKED